MVFRLKFTINPRIMATTRMSIPIAHILAYFFLFSSFFRSATMAPAHRITEYRISRNILPIKTIVAMFQKSITFPHTEVIFAGDRFRPPAKSYFEFYSISVSVFALHLPLVFIHADVGAPKDGTVVIAHVLEAVCHARSDGQPVNG